MEKINEKNSLTRLLAALRRWKWLSVTILAFIGVVLILTAHILQYIHHEAEPVSPSFLYGFLLPTMGTLGLAILSGGIFTFLLKTAEYNDLFKNEIRAVVLSDDVLLQKRDQLRNILLLEDGVDLMAESYREQVWHKMTHSFYTGGVPEIKTEVAATVFERLIRPERFRNYYFKDLTMRYSIKLLDAKHIEIIEEQSVILVKGVYGIVLHKEYYVWKLDNPEDKGAIEVKFLTIDRQDKSQLITEIPEQKKTTNGTDYLIRGQKIYVPIEGEKSEYELRMAIRVVHSLDILPYWRSVLGKFTDGLSISINYKPEDLIINLEMIDNNLKLSDVFLMSPGIDQKLEELLFPTDGFIIFVKTKAKADERNQHQ